ncbi:MAG TPA: homoserine O-acetyltransferase [Bacteroidota bacterium]|nr:homoserine O-acetyltransferase [Bacteroidota bacterium]
MSARITTAEIGIAGALELYTSAAPLRLESGESLGPVDVAYETYGSLNAAGTNAILVCHALTANAHAAGAHEGNSGWWDGLIGPGKAFDTDRYFVVCANILGSCYGTTGPTSIDPRTGRRYGPAFPFVSVRDIVRVQYDLLRHLGVQRLATVCGSSLGGMQVLEWGILFPEFCETIIPISAAARQPAFCIGLNAAARKAIMNDPTWNNGLYADQPAEGLALARMIGMLSYRSVEEFEERFGQERVNGTPYPKSRDPFYQVESYLQHQGQKLAERFDANTYITLTRATDHHDLTRGRGELVPLLQSLRVRTLSIGVSSDLRYPSQFQRELALHIPGAEYAEIRSPHGHDAFLIEFGQLNTIIGTFLSKGEIHD